MFFLKSYFSLIIPEKWIYINWIRFVNIFNSFNRLIRWERKLSANYTRNKIIKNHKLVSLIGSLEVLLLTNDKNFTIPTRNMLIVEIRWMLVITWKQFWKSWWHNTFINQTLNKSDCILISRIFSIAPLKKRLYKFE